MLNYESWVYTSVLENDLPWEKADITTFEEFKSKYTIHDSFLVGVFMDLRLQNTAMLIIQWDSVWLPEGISESTSCVEDWPYLFIKIEGIEQINTWRYESLKDVGRVLHSLEIESIDGKHILAISDVFDGQLQMVFNGGTAFLAFDKYKNILRI
jgi:hypothetical protein